MAEVMRGLDRDLADKMASKYDPTREREAREWLESTVERQFPEGVSFHEALKDGVILCEAINKMENINAYLQAAEKMGVNRHELFQTVDLFEAKNMVQVIDSVYALSRCAESKGYTGARIGPKLASKQEFHFSAETLAEGKSVLPILTSFKSGATLSGSSAFGSKREIGGVDLGKTGQWPPK
ncbi:calponin homology domain-containing protein [Chytriomyces sp. MP71]|nr:calponin homology domain-containing protein [Chytriomyces sp. MP71]